MAFLARKVRQDRWYEAVSSPGQPLPADPLSDLNTKGNSLSVWQVTANHTNLSDIVVGIASGWHHVQNMDLVLIDDAAVGGLGINVEASEGQTPLPQARGYHRDLVQLEAQGLVELAETLRGGDFRLFSEKEVGELLARYINEGKLNTLDLNLKVRSHLEKKSLI